MFRVEEKIKNYYEAWWNCEALDKVPLRVTSASKNWKEIKIPGKNPQNWMNPEISVNLAVNNIENTFYGGVALPFYIPSLGTDAFSGFLGAELNFAEFNTTPISWSDWHNPFLKDYSDLSKLVIKDDNKYFKKINELTEYAVKIARNRFLVGVTDIHPNMDSLAVLRGGPEIICMDLVDNPDGVKEAMKYIQKAWLETYEASFNRTKGYQQGTLSWIGLYSPGKTYPLQDDFTCLISAKMYEEFFLEALIEQINFLDHSIYHLDGPDALKHLDMLLDIKKLNAIQWVKGERLFGQPVEKEFPVYKKIQEKKKAIIVYCTPKELDLVLDNLKPEGLMIHVDCQTEDEAKELLVAKGWK